MKSMCLQAMAIVNTYQSIHHLIRNTTIFLCKLHTYGSASTGLSKLELHELKPVGFHRSTQCVVVVTCYT